MSEFDTYLSHYAAKLSEFDSKLSAELESLAETLSDIDTKALVLWQAKQHKANADPKKLRRSLYEEKVKQMQDAKEKTPGTCMTAKVLTARAKILTTSAHYLRVGVPPSQTCSSRPLQPTGRSVATATTP